MQRTLLLCLLVCFGAAIECGKDDAETCASTQETDEASMLQSQVKVEKTEKNEHKVADKAEKEVLSDKSTEKHHEDLASSCSAGLTPIPASIKLDFYTSPPSQYVKSCSCSCSGANANEYSGSSPMSGTTIAVWTANDYSIFHRTCLCAMTNSETPQWTVQYYNGAHGFNCLTPGTCNSGTSVQHDCRPNNPYYQSCFAHDMCLLTSNSQAHCAYLLPSGLAALIHGSR